MLSGYINSSSRRQSYQWQNILMKHLHPSFYNRVSVFLPKWWNMPTNKRSCTEKEKKNINKHHCAFDKTCSHADLADFPAVFFHISHWYLSWNNWQTPVTRVIWVGHSTTYDLHSFRTSWCHGQPTWQWVLRWSDTWLSVGCFKIIGKIPFSSSFLSFLAPQVL